MKAKSLYLSTILLALGLVSCGAPGASSIAPASSTPTDTSVADSSASEPEFVDYAHDGSVALGLDYADRSFMTDGIEKVTLYNTIDGDTAHFKGSGDTIIKARFYGVDTPESTGKVQQYGKKASNFTADLLNQANRSGTIVVSSAQADYGTPNPDSTGSRYVSLVWINTEKKNAPRSELYLLNLMLVQEGLSWVKNVNDMPSYVDTFYAAERQAKAFKLNLHSGVKDPDFPDGDYEYVSLLELKKAYIEQIEHEKAGDNDFVNRFHNKRVRVQGTVNGYSNHVLYLADFCYYLNEDGSPVDDSAMEIGVNGEYASINIFCGMSVPPGKFTTLGNYIEVSGLALDSQFGFQITDVNMPTIAYEDRDARLILSAKANTEEHALHVFEYSADELQAALAEEDYNALNCRIHMSTPIECTRAYRGDSGDMTLYFERPYDFRCYFLFTFNPDPDDTSVSWPDPEQFIGHKFTVTGVYAYHQAASGNTSMQILPSKVADLVLAD